MLLKRRQNSDEPSLTLGQERKHNCIRILSTICMVWFPLNIVFVENVLHSCEIRRQTN